ncbi:VWA domain-containing protein [Aureispira]|nr:VWA domain-containing protein [Aureispira sp.]
MTNPKINYLIKLLQNAYELPSKTSENFGIVQVKAPLVSLNTNKIHIIVTGDRSGSMGIPGKDGHPSLDHLKHVLINMLNYFVTLDNKIYVTINMFDHEINQVCKKLEVTKDSIQLVITNLQQIHPRGTTNIQKALESAGNSLIENIQNVHIFMTDGLPTAGAMKYESLATYLPDIKNDFIGFGLKHDEGLLRKLADKGNGEYHFINNLENGGVLYGEILHSIFYKVMQDIVISSKNCTFYNWRNNSWENTLNIPSLASEQERTFHIRVPWNITDDIVIEFGYIAIDKTLIEDVVKYENYKANETTTIDTRNIMVWKYLWRQKTMELMAKAAKYQTFSKDILREAIAKLGENIKIFQKKYKLENDDILNKLCDDLMVTLNSLDIQGGVKYIKSRFFAQASERLYNPVLQTTRGIAAASALRGCVNFRSHKVPAKPLNMRSITQTQAAVVRGCSGATTYAGGNLPKPSIGRGVSVPLPPKGNKHNNKFW